MKLRGTKQELDHDENEDEPIATTPKRSEPALKISYSGAEYVRTMKFGQRNKMKFLSAF